MKKLSWLTIIALMASLGFLTSCGDDEEELGPEVKFTAPATAADGDTVEVTSGTVTDFSFLLTAGTEKLASYDVVFANTSVISEDEKTSIEGEETSIEKTYKDSATTSGLLTISVTDKAGKTSQISVYIAVTQVAVPLTAKESVTLGGQGNLTTGSYYSLSTGVLSQGDAENAQGSVDLVYFYGSTNKATIVAPNDATVGGGSGNLSLCEGWSTKNATKLMKVDNIDFATVTDEDIEGLVPTSSIANDLSEGDVVVFKSVDGTVGVIEIGTITVNADGSIAISIKIKE